MERLVTMLSSTTMMRALAIAVILLAPSAALAGDVEVSRSLVLSEAPLGNIYLMGGDITVAAPVPADLHAAAGTVALTTPVRGDAALLGGTVVVGKPIAGDLRAFGGKVEVRDAVTGDLFAIAGTVFVTASVGDAWAAGSDVTLASGSRGKTTAYGASVTLGGEFAEDVEVTASDVVTLLPGTVIHGKLRYNAPQEAAIPSSVTIDGGVEYTGTSYLPTNEEAQIFAFAGILLFFLVRILAGLIAVGILAGLFPRFSQSVADEALSRSLMHFLLMTFLGFALMVATPVLVVILLVTFAGAAVALILLAAYVLLLAVAYCFAAVIAGAILARGIAKRNRTLWRDAVFGMLALSAVSLVPVAGWTIFLILFATSMGVIASLFYRFAFPKDDDDFAL